MNADGAISGINGEMLGYNMYAYCMNNPVNMSDSTGNWPKLVKEIGARAKYLVRFVVGVATAPIKATKAEIGMGIGLGAKGFANIKGVKIDGGISASITNSFSYNKGKFDIKNTTSTKVGVTFNEIIDFSYSTGKGHSFFDKECGCNILHDSFVEQSNCPANKRIKESESTIGVSMGHI